MSDTPETPDSTEAETDETTEQTEESASSASPTTPQLGMQSLLTRGSDVAARPGFRSPSNNKSKAMKKGKKGRKKKR